MNFCPFAGVEILQEFVEAAQMGRRGESLRWSSGWRIWSPADAAARARNAYRNNPAYRERSLARSRAKVRKRIEARESVRPPCPECGTPVLRKRSDRRFCSKPCRMRYWRKHGATRRG